MLIGLVTAPYAIALDAASFVISTAFMLPIRTRETLPERAEHEPKPKMLPELKEGLAYVVRHRHLKWIAMCTGASNFFGQVAFAIVLLYMARSLHISSFWAGVVFACLGVGSIAAALTTTRLQRAHRRRQRDLVRPLCSSRPPASPFRSRRGASRSRS